MYEKVEIHCRKFEGDCLARAERQLSASVSWLNSFPTTRLYYLYMCVFVRVCVCVCVFVCVFMCMFVRVDYAKAATGGKGMGGRGGPS